MRWPRTAGREPLRRLEPTAQAVLDDPDSGACDAILESDPAPVTARHTVIDAMHLAAARRVAGTALPILTYDVRQAQAARSLGCTVLGA
jgi:hypothetical protein